MPQTIIMRDVPAADVDELMQLYRDSGATAVEKQNQDDGHFTIVVTYPDDVGDGS